MDGGMMGMDGGWEGQQQAWPAPGGPAGGGLRPSGGGGLRPSIPPKAGGLRPSVIPAKAGFEGARPPFGGPVDANPVLPTSAKFAPTPKFPPPTTDGAGFRPALPPKAASIITNAVANTNSMVNAGNATMDAGQSSGGSKWDQGSQGTQVSKWDQGAQSGNAMGNASTVPGPLVGFPTARPGGVTEAPQEQSWSNNDWKSKSDSWSDNKDWSNKDSSWSSNKDWNNNDDKGKGKGKGKKNNEDRDLVPFDDFEQAMKDIPEKHGLNEEVVGLLRVITVEAASRILRELERRAGSLNNPNNWAAKAARDKFSAMPQSNEPLPDLAEKIVELSEKYKLAKGVQDVLRALSPMSASRILRELTTRGPSLRDATSWAAKAVKEAMTKDGTPIVYDDIEAKIAETGKTYELGEWLEAGLKALSKDAASDLITDMVLRGSSLYDPAQWAEKSIRKAHEDAGTEMPPKPKPVEAPVEIFENLEKKIKEVSNKMLFSKEIREDLKKLSPEACSRILHKVLKMSASDAKSWVTIGIRKANGEEVDDWTEREGKDDGWGRGGGSSWEKKNIRIEVPEIRG